MIPIPSRTSWRWSDLTLTNNAGASPSGDLACFHSPS